MSGVLLAHYSLRAFLHYNIKLKTVECIDAGVYTYRTRVRCAVMIFISVLVRSRTVLPSLCENGGEMRVCVCVCVPCTPVTQVPDTTCE